MNGDKQLIMVSESHEKTPVGFLYEIHILFLFLYENWLVGCPCSLLPMNTFYLLLAKISWKHLKKNHSKLKLMAFTWSQLGSVRRSWHRMVLAGLREPSACGSSDLTGKLIEPRLRSVCQLRIRKNKNILV